MHLISIETTPNPNSMKLNLDHSTGTAVTYVAGDANCPQYVANLLAVDGVKSVFVCHDFITLNREPTCDWKPLLDAAKRILVGSQGANLPLAEHKPTAQTIGQVAVFVQTFRGIHIQVKVTDAQSERRVALAQRFEEAAKLVQDQSGADYLKERYWVDWGVRYGSVEDIASQVLDEIEGTTGTKDLELLIAKALGRVTENSAVLKADLCSNDWHMRLLAVQQLGTSLDAVSLLIGALQDPSHQVRRLAAAALGASGSKKAVEPLSLALLNDSSIGVRRTAGDALSDLGDVSAQPAMCQALSDSNRLVRWRAARFLTEVGTEEALPFLRAAIDEKEFEVRLEIEAAIERIACGKEGSVPIWKRIGGGN